ncbi:MAG: winged helix-turn-helix domain-containing protein [Pseudomonadota bacterium]
MIAIEIQDPDIRTYTENLLSDKGFSVVSKDVADSVCITDVKGYEAIQNKELSIVIGDKSELDGVDAKYSMAFPIRAGALLDKIRTLQNNANVDFPDDVSIGPYKFMPIAMILQNEDSGIDIKLTEKERDLLFFLYTQNGEIASRQTILQKLWGYADGVETHTLETHFYRLRQKIEKDPANPELLVTSELGYILNI